MAAINVLLSLTQKTTAATKYLAGNQIVKVLLDTDAASPGTGSIIDYIDWDSFNDRYAKFNKGTSMNQLYVTDTPATVSSGSGNLISLTMQNAATVYLNANYVVGVASDGSGGSVITYEAAGASKTVAVTDSPASVTTKMAAVYNAAFTQTTALTLTAFSGGGQASATALTGSYNIATTVAADLDSVKLPTGSAGLEVTFRNLGAKIAAVYGQTGAAIDGGSANDFFPVAPGQVVTFTASSSTVWRSAAVGQPNPSKAAINASATATVSELGTGYITSTSAAATAITLPTATNMGAYLNAVQGTIFDFVVDNSAGASLVTLVLGSGITLPGYQNLNVPASSTFGVGAFRLVFTSATAAVLLRLGNAAATSAAINSTNTVTSAQLATGVLTSTSAAPTTMTLPTGTLFGGHINATVGTVFDFVVDNTQGASTVTIAAGATMVVVAPAIVTGGDTLTVAAGVPDGIGIFRIVFLSATSAIFFRLG